MKTTVSAKQSTVKRDWYLIDATDKILGRLASDVASHLSGKNKPEYTPNQDCGDNLIIINADKIHLTGKKETKKIYYKHTGHPGGLKETTPEKMKFNNKSTDIIKKAIKRMIPKGPLGYQQLSNCKIYSGEQHLHSAQNPLTLDISKLNNKNINR